MGVVGAENLLARIRDERGYTLSYHEIYARLEPGLLEAYGDLYRTVTLRARALQPEQREFLWVALLTSISEFVGSIHIDRGLDAGLTRGQLLTATELAGVGEAFDCLAFPARHWASRFPGYDPFAAYDHLCELAASEIPASLIHLTLLAVQGAHRREEPFLHHLRRCYELEVPEVHIGEALSYLLQPIGANGLLWATDLWLDSLQSGKVAGGQLAGITAETRRS